MDIWEKLQSVEQSLFASEQQLQAIAKSFPEPIFILDGYGKYLNVIGGDKQSLFHGGEYLIGKFVQDILPESLSETFMQAINKSISQKTLVTTEYMIGPGDIIGSPPESPKGKQWYEALIYPFKNQEDGISSVIWLPINITLRKNLEEQVKNLSVKDPLTEVFNRKYFLQIFEKEFSIAKRYGSRFSILQIVIDNFKEINNSYGQNGGDTVLKKFAAFCETTFRDSDLFARYGDGAFIGMLPNTTTLGAAIIAERIRAHTEELEVEYDNQSIQITISIGISQILDTDTNSNAALSRADAALYQAKKKGRNRIEIN
jgi:diguanylate cyclase (GGDEF)-like protein